MAKSNKPQEKKAKSAPIEDLTATENFLDQNKKVLIGIGVAIAVVLLGYFGYNHFVVKPKNIESQELSWNAFYDLEADSLDRAALGTDNYAGFEELAGEYKGTTGGDIANYSMGIISMQKGEFETALDYFANCDFEDVIVGTLCLGLQGDCYVELDNLQEAISIFEEAVAREANDFTTPMFLKKAGLVHEALGNRSKANANYKNIKENYPTSQFATDIDRYIGRTK